MTKLLRRLVAQSALGLGLVALVYVMPGAQAQTHTADSARAPFVGLYRLGAYAGHGDEPTGRISYDAAGRMSAMLFPPGREPVSGDASDEQYRAAMQGLIAYYGTYEVDADAGQVTHHVEAASNPAWVGTQFVRWYRFEGGDLTLSLNPDFENVLLWERMEE